MKKKLTIFLIFLILSSKTIGSETSTKSNIINIIKEIETLKFSFTQISLDKKENGICFLKRPHFLKCIYEDKKQKELIVNRKNLVIYHKRYDKIYFYPISKSYFVKILNKKEFENLILDGDLDFNELFFEIKYSAENKGQITFFFEKDNFNLSGWKITDLSGSETSFKINNIKKNQHLDTQLFNIPQIN